MMDVKMAYLKFYDKEREEFKKAYNILLDESQINKLKNKFRRKYKLDCMVVVKRRKKRNSGRFMVLKLSFTNIQKIELAKEISLGTMIHEFAHAIEYEKYGKTKHTKRMMNIVRKVHRWVKSKDYFSLEEREPDMCIDLSGNPDEIVEQIIASK